MRNALRSAEEGMATANNILEAIGIGFIPPHWRPDSVDEVQSATTDNAAERCRRLASEEAIFAGTSSGLNVIAALRIAERLGPDATVATIMIDSGLRYLSTDLYRRDQ
ncbi:MAG TPA: pyridoxal-phosphate dependent enzyme [Candidatus Limnocylindria bacterium]|nr:pyridoxal-phosphate dependent enzyme [Candidatus Limnocylindria bacterium]